MRDGKKFGHALESYDEKIKAIGVGEDDDLATISLSAGTLDFDRKEASFLPLNIKLM
ncbi:MAG: hypothetical protein M1813_006376 [Trichoglossum hirsutum]|nr:MAG: hypothetical protein M1813_006376 [Trichoglossum hirsutum]